jgi:predicted nucleic acid-binding protein
MKVRDAFQGVARVFFDTSPVVYYVESVPAFFDVARVAFDLILTGQIQGVVSPVTLAECVTLPIRLGQVELRQRFTDFLTSTDGILMVDIDAAVGQRAAELRGRYGLKLPDALQVAVAISAGCEAFLTNDVALKRVTELRVLPLVELEV